jgi:acyl-CoA synthetase (AMP-forming)/AMP-acid ligase II
VIDPEGWFHTGGVGWLDAKGFLTISDRVKDMIISGGEDIYPAEIENVLDQHPGIAEAAVIGLPDADWGETVCAVVALKPGHDLSPRRRGTGLRQKDDGGGSMVMITIAIRSRCRHQPMSAAAEKISLQDLSPQACERAL